MAKVTKKDTTVSPQEKNKLMQPEIISQSSKTINPGTIVCLNTVSSFFLQGKNGINLTPENTWCYLPKDISTENYNQILTALQNGQLRLNDKPMKSSMIKLLSIEDSMDEGRLSFHLRSIVNIYLTSEDKEVKEAIMNKLTKLEETFSKNFVDINKKHLILAALEQIERLK